MTTLYKPVLITTTEQAEALPEGTVAICAEDWPVEKSGGLWGRQGYPSSFLADTGDWTALVPVEAEEETTEAGGVSLLHGSTLTWPARTRLVTPWEEA